MNDPCPECGNGGIAMHREGCSFRLQESATVYPALGSVSDEAGEIQYQSPPIVDRVAKEMRGDKDHDRLHYILELESAFKNMQARITSGFYKQVAGWTDIDVAELLANIEIDANQIARAAVALRFKI